MKPFNTGLEDGNDPRRKLLLGLVALACVLALGLCLDLVSQRALPSGGQAATEASGAQGQSGQPDDTADAPGPDALSLASSVSGCSLPTPKVETLAAALSQKADELEDSGSERTFTCLSERVSSGSASVVALLDGTEWIFSCDEAGGGSWDVEAWKASTLVGLSDQLTSLQEQVKEDEEARARVEAERQQQEEEEARRQQEEETRRQQEEEEAQRQEAASQRQDEDGRASR